MNPAALLAALRPDFAKRLPEPETTVGHGKLRGKAQAAPLQVKQQASPVMRAFSRPITETDKFLLAFRCRADDDQNALLFVFEPCLQIDPVRPNIDILARRQIALLPTGVLIHPNLLQSRDGRGRQSRCIRPKQRRQGLGKVARRDTLEIEDRQQDLQASGSPGIGWQDRRREPDAACIIAAHCPIANTWLADCNRPYAGHDLAFRQVAMANYALMALFGLEIAMPGHERGNLGFDGLGEQRPRPVAQYIGERIGNGSWLNQLGDIILGHGVSLL